ncbi:MAG: hypothetical protein IJK75_01995 [Bacteroidales bacterium]|nr:hypothetical protein [Bacteroidales bacterium]
MLKLKYLILSILLSLFFFEGYAKPATSPQMVTDTIIIIDPIYEPDIPIPRTSSMVPIAATYNSMMSSVILYFSSNLGEIEVEVLNTFTGLYDSGFIDTQFLSAIIPVTGGPGHYIITFTLPSGQQYQGEFDV